MDERLNQTLVNALSKFAQEHRESWDEHLAEVVYSYNTAVQESTRHSPFEVMFGRKGNLPIDFNIHATYDADAKLQGVFAGNLNFQISVYIHILDMLHDHLINLLLQAEGDAEAQ